MEELLHGELQWLEGSLTPTPHAIAVANPMDADEKELDQLNGWIHAQGLKHGVEALDLADPATGEQKAMLDLAWPNGLQEELSQPVAVMLVSCL
jgi:hypothetical protein